MGVRLPQLILAKKIVRRAFTGHGSPQVDGVPKGHFAVYVGDFRKRFVIPTSYLNNPIFQDLLRRTEEESGFEHPSGLRIPCSENAFQALAEQLACA